MARLQNATSIKVMLLGYLFSLKQDKSSGNSPSLPDHHSRVISGNRPRSSNSFEAHFSQVNNAICMMHKSHKQQLKPGYFCGSQNNPLHAQIWTCDTRLDLRIEWNGRISFQIYKQLLPKSSYCLLISFALNFLSFICLEHFILAQGCHASRDKLELC